MSYFDLFFINVNCQLNFFLQLLYSFFFQEMWSLVPSEPVETYLKSNHKISFLKN